MPYAKLDVELVRRHFALLPVDERAAPLALYTRLVLSSSELLLDGVLPLSVVEAGATEIGLSRGRYRRREMHKLCTSLAEIGLVEVHENDTWLLTKWRDHHHSRKEVEEQRTRATERKRRSRQQTTLEIPTPLSQRDNHETSQRDNGVTSRARVARRRADADTDVGTSELGPKAEDQRPAAADQADEWPNREDPVFRLLATCRQIDTNTERTFRAFVGKVPEAAFDYVRDELERLRPEIKHDARYAVKMLQRIRVEGRLVSEIAPIEVEPNGNGARLPLTPAEQQERRELYVRNAGWLLTDADLEDELVSMGADADEIIGLTELAADLRIDAVP